MQTAGPGRGPGLYSLTNDLGPGPAPKLLVRIPWMVSLRGTARASATLYLFQNQRGIDCNGPLAERGQRVVHNIDPGLWSATPIDCCLRYRQIIQGLQGAAHPHLLVTLVGADSIQYFTRDTQHVAREARQFCGCRTFHLPNISSKFFEGLWNLSASARPCHGASSSWLTLSAFVLIILNTP